MKLSVSFNNVLQYTQWRQGRVYTHASPWNILLRPMRSAHTIRSIDAWSIYLNTPVIGFSGWIC